MNAQILYERIKGKYDIYKTNTPESYRLLSRILKETKDELIEHVYFREKDDPEQAWKTLLGNALELILTYIINDALKGTGIKAIKFSKKALKPSSDEMDKINYTYNSWKNMPKEEQKKRIRPQKITIKQIQEERYNRLKGQIMVFLNGENKIKVIPDIDLILYYEENLDVIAILSVKKKFRERIAQVAYWTIKLRRSMPKVKNFMITLDEDEELSREFNNEDEMRKGRAIAEIDTNGTYVASEKQIIESEKIRTFNQFIDDIKTFIAK